MLLKHKTNTCITNILDNEKRLQNAAFRSQQARFNRFAHSARPSFRFFGGQIYSTSFILCIKVSQLVWHLCCSGVLGPLGTFLGPFGGILGCLGCLLGRVGSLWEPLGLPLGPLGRVSGTSWGDFGVTLGPLGVVLGPVGVVFGL